MEYTDEALSALLLTRDEQAFETVFKRYFNDLHAYACTMLKAEAPAEEIVQQVFFKIWDRSDALRIQGSLAAYLYRSVHNECLNYIKHLKIRKVYHAHTVYHYKEREEEKDTLSVRELEQKIADALERLPEQCRTIFQMSRFEELKYREIAEKLDLSVKTVENQMGKALKLMREELADYLPFIILLFLNQTNSLN